ncbi:hypothetical protein RD792_015293 [Penstemon davidsonii]|uniref:Bystin n=1 Tax=Penstemon davidsonii TaxID=160366 RepID=A0ABR0CT74_9LAMI|nr:hypothetical protein RD792_015293 [Penstemon davidsonii]
MSKKRERITNPEPFTPFESDSVISKKRRSKPPKTHQLQHEIIPCSKILKQADLQQKEILKEERGAKNKNNTDNSNVELVFQALHNLKDNYDDDDEIDDFEGFTENQGQLGEYEDEIEDALQLWEKALLSKEIIVEKIKDVQVSSGVQSVPILDASILYKGVGKLLNIYTAGKMPKAFKRIPYLQYWEQVLFLTEPEKWSPSAMYEATKIFASNMDVKKVERFYKIILLPYVREYIRKNDDLHFDLCQSLRKALYKPAAFYKGILFPLCESRTCSRKEANIVAGIIKKNSIPSDPSGYFITLLIEKKYALKYCVLDALVAHFMKFYAESRVMPLIWHQSLLAFAQRYKNELTKEDKDNLYTLLEKQKHESITPEILRELNNSRNRGEKEEDLMSIYILF